MSESNAIVIADTYLNPVRWDQMKALAESLVQSKAFPKNVQNAPQALVIMQVGIEMGLKPMEAINGLSIINGAVNPWGKTTVKLLRNHGWRIQYEMLMERGGGCRATVTKDDESYTDTLYFDSAAKSGWVGDPKNPKIGWKEGANREMKLRYGVLSKIIKTYIPEVLGSAQDIAEVAEDYVIEETTPVPEQVNVAGRPQTEEVITTTPDERKKGLKEFLETEKNKPKTTDLSKITKKDIEKDAKPTQKAAKSVQTTSKVDQTMKPLPVPQQVEEGEIVDEPETGATDVAKGVK